MPVAREITAAISASSITVEGASADAAARPFAVASSSFACTFEISSRMRDASS